jgi:hypothetical protein
MTDQTAEAVLLATPRAPSRKFLVTLALITLIPLIGVPLALTAASAFGTGLPGSLTLVLITGPMHVAATAFFYFDRAFRPVLRESAVRCLWSVGWLPLGILALGVGGLALIGPWARLILFAFHNVWLFYHYQRQNFGLISFVSTNVGHGRLSPRVNTTLNVAALGGIVALLGTPGFYVDTEGIVTPHAYVAMRTVGTAIYVVSLVMTFWMFRREPRLRENAWLTGALILGIAFFLPAIAFRSVVLAFIPYAIAHGAQYLVMMSVVSGRSSRGWLALLIMCGLAVTLGYVMNQMTLWPMILIAAGLTEVHFLVDARVWRLREPRQRAIMNERFDFLLAA